MSRPRATASSAERTQAQDFNQSEACKPSATAESGGEAQDTNNQPIRSLQPSATAESGGDSEQSHLPAASESGGGENFSNFLADSLRVRIQPHSIQGQE